MSRIVIKRTHHHKKRKVLLIGSILFVAVVLSVWAMEIKILFSETNLNAIESSVLSTQRVETRNELEGKSGVQGQFSDISKTLELLMNSSVDEEIVESGEPQGLNSDQEVLDVIARDMIQKMQESEAEYNALPEASEIITEEEVIVE